MHPNDLWNGIVVLLGIAMLLLMALMGPAHAHEWNGDECRAIAQHLLAVADSRGDKVGADGNPDGNDRPVTPADVSKWIRVGAQGCNAQRPDCVLRDADDFARMDQMVQWVFDHPEQSGDEIYAHVSAMCPQPAPIGVPKHYR